MFPLRRILLPIGGAALLCANVFADTVILKTGEKLEGKILSETAADITMEVKISAGVVDQSTIARSNISKIEKEQLDEVAWLPLKNLKPGTNSLTAAQYDAVMRPLQGFVSDFPGSAHASEAAAILATFAEEKRRVDGGEVRLGAKWLSKEEVATERYQIDAMLAYQQMRGQAGAGDAIGALNTFEAIEASYNGARIYPDAVEAAKSVMAGLKLAVDRAQRNYQAMQAEFEQGVANAGEPQKSELLAARQQELAKGEAALAAAERSGMKWPPLNPRSDKSIEALALKIPTEQQRLATIEVSKMRESLSLAERAKKEIADKNGDAADETLRKATELWGTNELATRLAPQLAELRAATPAEPAPTEMAATPTPEPEKTASTSEDDVLPPEPEKSFFLTPGGIIVVLIGLALAIAGLVAYNKIRHKASDVLE